MFTRRTDSLATDLDDLPLPAELIVAGSPTASVRTLDEAWGVEIGIWSLTPGVVTDTEVDEIFVVVAGRGRVDFADGESVDLAPGVVVHLRAGEQTTWTVTETLRKIFLTP